MLIKCHKWLKLPVNGLFICCLLCCHWSEPAADGMGASKGWRPQAEGSINAVHQSEPQVGKRGFPQHYPSVRGLWQPSLPATSLKLTFICQWMMVPFPALAGKCWGAQVTKWNQEAPISSHTAHSPARAVASSELKGKALKILHLVVENEETEG